MHFLHLLTLFFILFASPILSIFFFLNDPAPTEIYPLPLHDALPILRSSRRARRWPGTSCPPRCPRRCARRAGPDPHPRREAARPDPRRRRRAPAQCTRRRSEEHTSELQSPCNLVCRLLLEKKKNTNI